VPSEYLPFVLDPSRFARVSADERRMLLFSLLNVRTTPEAIEQMLVERGVDEQRAAEAASMMHGGFAATYDYAVEQAKAARAAWRALTGEVYGTRKAETWKAPDVQFDGARLDAVSNRIREVAPLLAQAQREVGAIEQRLRMAERGARTVADLRAKIAQRPAIEQLIADDTKLLAAIDEAYIAAQAVPCPHCGALVSIRLDHLEPYTGSGASEEQQRLIERYSLADRHRIAKAIRDNGDELIEIERARTTLVNAEAYERVEADAVERARQRAAQLEAESNALLAERRDLERDQAQALEAEKRTEAARGYHADVTAWSAVADLVAASGIPSELLQGALGEMNTTLRGYADTSGFMQVALTPGLEIVANRRPYALLSKSEQWRADAALAVAVAHYSGLCFVLFDEFDVLDSAGREAMFAWLDHLITTGILDAAFMCGTLRAAPTDEPGFMQCHWLGRQQREAAA
jgi:hypothetical protein